MCRQDLKLLLEQKFKQLPDNLADFADLYRCPKEGCQGQLRRQSMRELLTTQQWLQASTPFKDVQWFPRYHCMALHVLHLIVARSSGIPLTASGTGPSTPQGTWNPCRVLQSLMLPPTQQTAAACCCR